MLTRVFLVCAPVRGGGERVIAIRLSAGSAEAVRKGIPGARIRREIANKDLVLSPEEQGVLA